MLKECCEIEQRIPVSGILMVNLMEPIVGEKWRNHRKMIRRLVLNSDSDGGGGGQCDPSEDQQAAIRLSRECALLPSGQRVELDFPIRNKSNWTLHRLWPCFVSECMVLVILLSLMSPTVMANQRSSSSQPLSQTRASTTTVTGGRTRLTNDYVQATYVVPNTTLSHLQVDHTTKRVYVGAVNRLFQLNSNLQLEVALETGPKQDSPLCLGMSSSCVGVEKKSTPNVNKVLVIDYDNKQLIACGSVYQGACQLYSLPNISHSVNHIEEAIAANDDVSSTFAFVGPQRYLGNNSKVLYISVTYTKNGPFRDNVPAISSRRLETLDVAEMGFSKTPSVEMDSKLRDYFRVKYKHGFHWNDHAYFVTVQPKSHLRGNQEEGYVSRIARVCIGDPSYSTYTEITLQCFGPNGTSYNVIEAVTTVRASSSLASALHVPVGELLLIGAFANSVNHTMYTYPNVALCVYPMSEIEQTFNENIHMCLNGSVQSRGMDYIAGSLGNCPESGVSMECF